MKKILVTGANGQLGKCLREIAPNFPKYQFTFTDIEELDITNSAAVTTFVAELHPDWVINAAAYTAVDKAELEPEIALLLNAIATGNLSRASREIEAGFVHISTDYVFAGDDPSPLKEDASINPQSVYGRTKAEGEREAALNPKHVILRTSWLYSVYGNNFVKTMRKLGAEKDEIGVVSDQWGSPTSAHDLAKGVMSVIENPHYGLYHFSNEGITNWALFAEEIMTLSGLICHVNHISTADYPTAAKRPTYSIMNKQKFSKTFKVSIPEWEASLEDVINELDKDSI